MRALILALLLPLPAQAACPGETLLACPIAEDYLEVCLNGDQLTYTYSAKGQTQLALTAPLAGGTYTPWNGIGSSIWESISFRNNNYNYSVFMSFDRMDEDAQPQWGVAVDRDDQLLATLLCDAPDAATPLDGLYGEMEARGFCWNRTAFQWQTGGCP